MTFFFQMSVLPSVQPFHAIAYPIDPLLALEIRYHQDLPNVVLTGMDSRISFIYSLLFCIPSSSRKYAAHCSLIASRFALPPFNHPAPNRIKRDIGNERLRVGYVFRCLCVHSCVRIPCVMHLFFIRIFVGVQICEQWLW